MRPRSRRGAGVWEYGHMGVWECGSTGWLIVQTERLSCRPLPVQARSQVVTQLRYAGVSLH